VVVKTVSTPSGPQTAFDACDKRFSKEKSGEAARAKLATRSSELKKTETPERTFPR
jgi:hypothetical protein